MYQKIYDGNTLSIYQAAATNYCQSIVGLSPYDSVMDGEGKPVQRWMYYASQMHELKAMLNMMNNYYLVPFKQTDIESKLIALDMQIQNLKANNNLR